MGVSIKSVSMRRFLWIGLSVCLVCICLPSGPVKWLAFVAFAPLAIGLQGIRPLEGFVLGWIFGFAIWIISTWWIYNGAVSWLGLSPLTSLIVTGLFCLFQGLPYAIFGLICGWFEKHNFFPTNLFYASLLTILIFLRPTLCPGSPVIALYSWPLSIQMADIGGVSMVGFILLLCNWLLADIVGNSIKPKKIVLPAISLVLILTLNFGYGMIRLNYFKTLEKKANADDYATITSVQPNFPIKGLQGIEKTGPYMGALGALVKLTITSLAASKHSDLIIWPESPIPIDCECDNFDDYGVKKLSSLAGAPVLLNCIEYEYDSNPLTKKACKSLRSVITKKIKAKYNSAWLVTERCCPDSYRKNILVPFGEQTPLKNKCPWMKKLLGRELEYSPGKELSLIEFGNKHVQPLICFEGGFPELARQGILKGTDIFANLSDDAWFESGKAAEFHLGMTLFRTIEERRPLVRCTNSGFGAAIKATGEIIPGSVTPMNDQAVIQSTLFCPEDITFYARIGHFWLVLPAFYVVIQIGRVVARKRSPHIIY
jgi:apolipoprotein N-acyltransferase